MWDERVPIHVASEFYDVEGFLAGRSALREFELAELGDVRGRTLVHPQCHFGLDTLSWARLGARVTGLDFSAPAIAAAREIAVRAGIEAEFVEGNVYDAVAAPRRPALRHRLHGSRSDHLARPTSSAGRRRWPALLEPDGRLYLAEFHPLTDVFADDSLAVERSVLRARPTDVRRAGDVRRTRGARPSTTESVEWRHTARRRRSPP